MNKNLQDGAQMFLRLALAIGFLSAVADRFGLWGPYGTANVGWGDWQHFAEYCQTLMFFLPAKVAEVFGAIATFAEVVFGVMLIIGWFTRLAAIGSAFLLLSFGLSMTLALGVHAPLNYSVFTACAASLLLAALPGYRWSVDSMRK